MVEFSHVDNVPLEEASMHGAEVNDTYIQWLITKDKQGAPNFAMRRFVLKPGAYVELHQHWNEHEIYIISGEGVVTSPDNKEKVVKEGNFIFVPGDEPHGYRNDTKDDFVFLCMVPNADKK